MSEPFIAVPPIDGPPINSAVTREDEPGDGAGGNGGVEPVTRADSPGFHFAKPSARTRSDDPADRAGHAPGHDYLPGALAQRFSFVRLLGPQGGQGQVALYQDNEDRDRQVVIKVYRAQPATPEVWGLWEEAQDATGYIVRLVECHLEDDRAYEVTDYVPGGSLADRDGRARLLPPADVERVVRQLTAALQYIHTGLSQRFVHRDLAPGNVLVRSTDPLEVAITDFGVAIPQRETYIASGVAGTPLYAALEAWFGQSSPARDWWSLGMIALELLQGHHPFEVPGRVLDDNLLGSEIGARAVPIDDQVDDRWRLLIRGLLTRDPRRRWNHEQVQRWLDGEAPTVEEEEESAAVNFRRGTPFPVGNAVVYTPQELAGAIAANWAHGAALVIGRQWQDLRTWAAVSSPDLDATLAEAERVFVIPRLPVDRAVAELIVRLDPDGSPVFRDQAVDEPGLVRLATAAASGTGEPAAAETLDALYTSESLRASARLPGCAGLALLHEQWHRWVEIAEQAATEAVGSLDALPEAHLLRGLLLRAAMDRTAEEGLARQAAILLDPRSRRVGWFRRLAEAAQPPDAAARHAVMLLASPLLEDPVHRGSIQVSDQVRQRVRALRAQAGAPSPKKRPRSFASQLRPRLAAARTARTRTAVLAGLGYAVLALLAAIGIGASTAAVEGLLSGGLLLAAGGCLAFGLGRRQHPLANALLGGFAGTCVGLALAAIAGPVVGLLAGPSAGWPVFWMMWVVAVVAGTALGAAE
ncbi:MAG: protein kinase domain-containing protein [Pseudonocardiaceae bacterium]